jgi:hypothetical protein
MRRRQVLGKMFEPLTFYRFFNPTITIVWRHCVTPHTDRWEHIRSRTSSKVRNKEKTEKQLSIIVVTYDDTPTKSNWSYNIIGLKKRARYDRTIFGLKKSTSFWRFSREKIPSFIFSWSFWRISYTFLYYNSSYPWETHAS